MGTIADLLPNPTALIRPGAIFLGPMAGVDHPKFCCASPLKGQLTRFDNPVFSYKAQLLESDLEKVRQNIKMSGLLTQEEVDLFQL